MSNIKRMGFTCGSFDLLHAGHILMLKECRGMCDFLVVGLQKDPTVDRPEKNRPIQSVEERRIQLEAVRYVDFVITYTTERELEFILVELSNKHGDLRSKLPKYMDTELVRFLGVDWKGKNYTGHDLPIEVVFNTRDHGYSSSELRDRVFASQVDILGRRREEHQVKSSRHYPFESEPEVE